MKPSEPEWAAEAREARRSGECSKNGTLVVSQQWVHEDDNCSI